jgi:hypothetical protein
MGKPTTLPDLKKLREVAERATPGPWRVTSHGSVDAKDRQIASVQNGGFVDVHTADFIATCNPQTILALLDAYEASATDAERYKWLRDNTDGDFGPTMVWGDDWSDEYPGQLRVNFNKSLSAFDAAIDQAIDAAPPPDDDVEGK